MFGELGAILIVLAVTHVVMAVAVACRPHAGPAFAVLSTVGGAGGGCALDAWLVPGHVAAAIGAAEVAVVAVGMYAFMSRWLHPVGAAVWSSWLLLGAVLLGWGVLFLGHLDVSRMTSSLLWATSALSAVTLPRAVVQTREGWEPLLGRRRRRAGGPRGAGAGCYAPRFWVHVPCHAEPPHIVIATLDRLARLDYPDFEVLVIDNNTADPELWWPVKAHCERLGERFRFLHVEGITGAKAGALNRALDYTCPRAQLIAAVDPDYPLHPPCPRPTPPSFPAPPLLTLRRSRTGILAVPARLPWLCPVHARPLGELGVRRLLRHRHGEPGRAPQRNHRRHHVPHPARCLGGGRRLGRVVPDRRFRTG